MKRKPHARERETEGKKNFAYGWKQSKSDNVQGRRTMSVCCAAGGHRRQQTSAGLDNDELLILAPGEGLTATLTALLILHRNKIMCHSFFYFTPILLCSTLGKVASVTVTAAQESGSDMTFNNQGTR